MIYLIDNGYRIKSDLITLVNQVKSPEAYNVCLGCKVNGKLGVEVGVNVNVSDNVNDNVNGNDNVIDNDKVNDKVNEKVNYKVNDNNNINAKQESPLSVDDDDDDDDADDDDDDDDNILFGETKQIDKPCSKYGCRCETPPVLFHQERALLV